MEHFGTFMLKSTKGPKDRWYVVATFGYHETINTKLFFLQTMCHYILAHLTDMFCDGIQPDSQCII